MLLDQLMKRYVLPDIADSNPEEEAFKCSQCLKKYKRMRSLVKHIQTKHNSPVTNMSAGNDQDSIMNYSRNALTLTFIAKNFLDAKKRGDGERIYRLYKYLLVYFKVDGRHKYSYQSLHFLAQINFLLPPALAHELKWNRFVNNLGKPDSNVELDRELEHRNKYVKEDLGQYQGKVTEKSLERCSKTYDTLQKIVNHFDEETGLNAPSGKHTSADWKDDVLKLAAQYTEAKIVENLPGRSHNCFPDFPTNYLHKLQSNKFKTWMYEKLQELSQLGIYQHRNTYIKLP